MQKPEVKALYLETGQKISIGRNVSGINDGLRINENNYWFTTSEFRLGDTSNYLWISGSRDNPASSVKLKTDDISIDTNNFMISSSYFSPSSLSQSFFSRY